MLLLLQSFVVGLLLAACSSQTGVAARSLTTRATDVTCGGRFPKAGDGFAKRPNGCSSLGENTSQIRDKWGSANFGGVCDDHDRCYYTLGTNIAHCNANFCDGLRNACKKAYCKKIWGCAPGLHSACRAIAEGYCGAVRAFAPGIHADAQEMQRQYQTCLVDNGGIAAPLPPPTCSNGKPEGATWSKNEDGSRCLTTFYACRNLKIVVTRSFRAPNCIEP